MNASTTVRRQRRISSRPAWLVAAALAAASLGAITQALAQKAAPLTRAEVTAELARARASGELERSLPEAFHMVWLYQDTDRAAVAGRQDTGDKGDGGPAPARGEQVKAELAR